MTRVRRAVSILILVLVTGLLVTGASGTSCPVLLEWHGVRYDSANIDEPVRFLARVGTGEVPACGESDTGAGCSSLGSGSGEPIDVHRLQGVDPAVAVGGEGSHGRRAYLAVGYFSELPSHPLHQTIWGSSRRPNELAGWRCDASIALVGDVEQTPGFGLVFEVLFEGGEVERQHGFTALFVDVGTVIRGFDLHGLPHIEGGDRIRATVRECRRGEQYKVVARTIEPA
jgi:Family of unknown function (DUF6281)